MKKITTEPRYFEHEGGTKFYEVVEFWNPDDKRFVLVKRWGKIGTLGETMCESHSSLRACNAAAEKLIKSKMGRGYQRTPSTIGLHARARSFTEVELIGAIQSHYRSTPFLSELTAMLDVDKIRGLGADMLVVDELNEIVSEEPGPEPDRGESWGTW